MYRSRNKYKNSKSNQIVSPEADLDLNLNNKPLRRNNSRYFEQLIDEAENDGFVEDESLEESVDEGDYEDINNNIEEGDSSDLNDYDDSNTNNVDDDSSNMPSRGNLLNKGKSVLDGVKNLKKIPIPTKYKLIIALAAIMLSIFLLLLLVSLDMFDDKGGNTLNSSNSSSSNNNVSQSYNNACDAMSISDTTLSRSEFISLMQEHYSDSTSSGRKAFYSNAGTIYDIATKNNINPELVVVRAESEGFSPGGSTNNYWGIGCYNDGSGSCYSYNSFTAGVTAFVENVSRYDSVSSMMLKYAYIGRYWFNPGSWSDGGCVYYPYIKEYLSISRLKTVENACSGAKCYMGGGSGCVATTDEDQLAYSKWQVYKMAENRKGIFGIAPDVCNTYSEKCTIYAQGDSRWGSINLGNSSSSMSGYGCAVTAISIGISCSGTDIYIDDFNPGTFVKELNKGNCFMPGGGIYWGCNKISEVANVQLANNHRNLGGKTVSEKNAIIASYDLSSHFIVVGYANETTSGHYVVYTSTSGNNYVTKDPGGGKVSNVPIKDVDQFVVYKY